MSRAWTRVYDRYRLTMPTIRIFRRSVKLPGARETKRFGSYRPRFFTSLCTASFRREFVMALPQQRITQSRRPLSHAMQVLLSAHVRRLPDRDNASRCAMPLAFWIGFSGSVWLVSVQPSRKSGVLVYWPEERRTDLPDRVGFVCAVVEKQFSADLWPVTIYWSGDLRAPMS